MRPPALASTEHRVGSDLAELRSMQEMASSDSALRRSGEDIRAQLRENAATEKSNQELLAVLAKAQDDPGRFVATPNRLLESHPSLRRLKDGLVDAQLRTATLRGTMAADHPRVQAAREAEEEIGRHLHNELALARRGIEVELRVIGGRRALLEEQLAKTNERLDRLATVRAGYANEVAETKKPGGAAGPGGAKSGRSPRRRRQCQGRQPHQPHRHARRRHSPGRSRPDRDRLQRPRRRPAGRLRNRVPERAVGPCNDQPTGPSVERSRRSCRAGVLDIDDSRQRQSPPHAHASFAQGGQLNAVTRVHVRWVAAIASLSGCRKAREVLGVVALRVT